MPELQSGLRTLAQVQITPEMIESLRTSDSVQILQIVVVLLTIAIVVGLPIAAFFGYRMLVQMGKQTDKYDGLKGSIDVGNQTAVISAASLQRLTEQNEVRHTQAQTTDERVLTIMENQTVGIAALTTAIHALDARTASAAATGELAHASINAVGVDVKKNGDAMNERLTPIEARMEVIEHQMNEALGLLRQLVTREALVPLAATGSAEIVAAPPPPEPPKPTE